MIDGDNSFNLLEKTRTTDPLVSVVVVVWFPGLVTAVLLVSFCVGDNDVAVSSGPVDTVRDV